MKTLDDYKKFISSIKQETGIDAITPDDSGLVSFRVDDTFNVNLQFVEHLHTVLCFVELCQLPQDAPRSVYRELLVGGLFGKDTAGGYFSIEDNSEVVVYNYFFNGESLDADPGEFVSSLEKIIQLCGLWKERIEALMSPEEDDSASKDDTVRALHNMNLYP